MTEMLNTWRAKEEQLTRMPDATACVVVTVRIYWLRRFTDVYPENPYQQLSRGEKVHSFMADTTARPHFIIRTPQGEWLAEVKNGLELFPLLEQKRWQLVRLDKAQWYALGLPTVNRGFTEAPHPFCLAR